MVLRKPKSKRLTTRHRVKIARKAREHHRQLRKGGNADGKVVRKSRKDPGIPTMFPMKEGFLKKMEEDRMKEKMQKEARKQMMKQTAEDVASEEDDEDMMDCEDDLEKMVTDAQEQNEQFTEPSTLDTFFTTSLNTERDNSRRAFYREFKTVFDIADVILQVLDARDPLGCRVKEVEEAILATGGKKKLVLVLNKVDLVPMPVVQGWLKYLRREFPAVAFKASTQEGRSSISQSRADLADASTDLTKISECLGADTLIQLLKNYSRSLSVKTRVTVGVIGYPNVGKSSLINSLKRSKVCKVGAAPGVTTARQEIHLDKNISLLDCPGIVFAGGERIGDQVMLRNCLKVEQLADPLTPAHLIIDKTSRQTIQTLYTLPDISMQSAPQVLSTLARRLGKLRKGGLPDLEATARHLLNDWNSGKIEYWTPVPTDRDHLVGVADVVTAWAPAFQLDDIERMEVEDGGVLSEVPKLVSVQEESTTVNQMDTDSEIDQSITPTASASADTDDYSFTMSAQDRAVNPQLNQQRLKDLKAQRKKQSKLANRASK